MPLSAKNIIQAAEADLRRAVRNAQQAALSKEYKVSYEQYAFHRDHVRRVVTAQELIVLALMDPAIKTTKHNTRMIYGDAALLVQAAREAGGP